MWVILGLVLLLVLAAGALFLLGRTRVWRPARRLIAAATTQTARLATLSPGQGTPPRV